MLMVLFFFFFLYSFDLYYFCFFFMFSFVFWFIFFFLFFFFSVLYLFFYFFIDNFSYVFCCLWIWLGIMMILSMYMYFFINFNYFFFYVCTMMMMLLLVFLVVDVFFFFFFFEFSLIPMFLIVFGWGYQPERLMAGFYLIFYTLFASLPFFLVILSEIELNGEFNFFFGVKMMSMFKMFFLIFSFLVKFPMFGFHSWLTKAHVEAPVSGSMILAGVMLKLGGYGFIRCMDFIYFYLLKFSHFFITVSMYGGILIGFFCFIQSDMKILIAYSSICHMSLVISGLFSLSSWSVLGSVVFMLGHGFTSSGLFYLIGLIYDRFSSRSFFLIKGLLLVYPSLGLMWFFLCSLNMSCPPSISLMSEMLLILGLLSWSNFMLIFLFFSLFLSACYSMTFFFLCQHGNLSFLFKITGNCVVREYLVLFFHIFLLFIFFYFKIYYLF
uniref:NADH-ubiquinone oxidoreductase chain 4 n=1 Tax=Lophops carinata TaxID=130616 RepID=A0A7M1ICB6_9HEMI|nr:NADH dehydrogenase subunit 4 [Lophops carinata]QOQ36886.1 NADH dehydrogenase subunit 4 [Lophops carinata]